MAQQVLSCAVLPKLAYGLQIGRMPQVLIRNLRGAIKAAMGYAHRIHSWEVLCIVANPGHRLDPHAFLMYTHLVAVIFGLRESEGAREEWRRLEEQRDERRSRMGPFFLTREYLDTLEIQTHDFGLRWTWREQDMHLLKREKAELMHILRDAIRHWMARRAENARPHLQGLGEMDLEGSRLLTKKKGFPFRKELIALMADGVWTKRKKYLCGYTDAETCTYCGAPSESVAHILYHCRRWRPLWGNLEPYLHMLEELPAAASLCAFKPCELPPPLDGRWMEIQKTMARILYERLEREHDHPKPREVVLPRAEDPLQSAPRNSPSERSDPWDFRFTERLHGGQRPWAFSRRAWHTFQLWASQVRVIRDLEQPRTTILEMMLSFIGLMKGHRFESGDGPERHGGWVSVQLERFRSACLSFQQLTYATPIMGAKPDRQPPGGWGSRYGFPRLSLMERTLVYPARDFVWKTLDQMRVAGLPKGLCARTDCWRRWSPGIPGSQEKEGGHFEPPRLWELPSYRITGPENPPSWRAEIQAVKPFLAKLHAKLTNGDCSSRLWELVMSEGAFTKKGVQACTSRLYYEGKRVKALETRNQHAMTRRQHFAGLWGAKERPKCRICMKTGYASRQMGWMALRCGGWDLGEQARDIQVQTLKELQAHRATVTALDAETRLLAASMI